MAAPAPEYTAYIKDLVDYNGNIIYPRTKVEAIYDNDGNVLSIPKHFIINVTADSEGNFTADKTYAEILEAYNAGYVLTVLVEYMQHFILDTFINDTFTFISNTADTMGVIMFTSSGITVDEVYFQPIPRIKEGDAGKILIADDSGNAVWTEDTKVNKPSFSQYTILTSDWSSGIYSFESDFPNATYDIEIELDSTATESQVEAWSNAKPTSVFGTNTMKALGDVPTVDIPIIVKAVSK